MMRLVLKAIVILMLNLQVIHYNIRNDPESSVAIPIYSDQQMWSVKNIERHVGC
jgi:hypothetical protein